MFVHATVLQLLSWWKVKTFRPALGPDDPRWCADHLWESIITVIWKFVTEQQLHLESWWLLDPYYMLPRSGPR